jgi:hypothetical protein
MHGHSGDGGRRRRGGDLEGAHGGRREAIYNSMPLIAVILQKKRAAGLFDPDDPIPETFTFVPTINGLWYQAPLIFNTPLSFAILPTKDGRWVTPTFCTRNIYTGFSVCSTAPQKASQSARRSSNGIPRS